MSQQPWLTTVLQVALASKGLSRGLESTDFENHPESMAELHYGDLSIYKLDFSLKSYRIVRILSDVSRYIW